MSTLDTVQQLLIEQFGLTQDQVHVESKLDALGIDSLATIEFFFLLEDKFNLPESDYSVTVSTVGEIVAHIDFLIAQERGSAP
jgi:acyl carrier protein